MKRDTYIKTRLTESEKNMLVSAAERLNMTVSEYIRYVALPAAAAVVSYEPGGEDELVLNLNSTSVNMVQRVKVGTLPGLK